MKPGKGLVLPYSHGEDATYFRTLCDYIHLNPVRAGLRF